MLTLTAFDSAIVSFALFSIAVLGFLSSGNLLRMLMFLELMLNAANIAMVGMAPGSHGQVFTIMFFAVAASEAGVGLAIVIAAARHFKTLGAAGIKELKN